MGNWDVQLSITHTQSLPHLKRNFCRKEKNQMAVVGERVFERELASPVPLTAHFHLVLANWPLNTILIMLALEKEEYLV